MASHYSILQLFNTKLGKKLFMFVHGRKEAIAEALIGFIALKCTHAPVSNVEEIAKRMEEEKIGDLVDSFFSYAELRRHFCPSP